MSESKFNWVDNPTLSGQAICDTDILNECLMHLKYDNAGGGGLEIGDIGIAPLGIDETKGKRRYLNGQLIIQEQYIQFTNKVKSAVALYPSLACTESEWQTIATMTVGGQVGKFVIDDKGGTIRLPKIIMPVQGLTDLSKLGEIVEAGLPNITGQATFGGASCGFNGGATGALKSPTVSGHPYSAGGGSYSMISTVTFDASNSNPIYSNSNTVQQEQIQYPYFIQVATGAETEDNIINEIELNNPFSLLDYKYSEYELNNLSWLKSVGQWNSKAVYPAVYELLLKIYNGTETKAGVSVKLSTEEYTDYDFVLNTAEETFKLLVKTTNRILVDKKEATTDDPSWYNLYSDGWLEQGGKINRSGTITFLKTFIDVNYTVCGEQVAAGSGDAQFVGAYRFKDLTPSTMNFYNGQSEEPSVTWQASGYTEIPADNNYLYFYVGETVQNANLINAGRIEESLATKLDRGNKQEIVSWGLPDYSKAINITFTSNGLNYTAPDNGILSARVIASGNATATINVNNVAVLSCDSGQKDVLGQMTGQVVVRKGDVITSTNIYLPTTTDVNYAVFFPMKGAN